MDSGTASSQPNDDQQPVIIDEAVVGCGLGEPAHVLWPQLYRLTTTSSGAVVCRNNAGNNHHVASTTSRGSGGGSSFHQSKHALALSLLWSDLFHFALSVKPNDSANDDRTTALSLSSVSCATIGDGGKVVAFSSTHFGISVEVMPPPSSSSSSSDESKQQNQNQNNNNSNSVAELEKRVVVRRWLRERGSAVAAANVLDHWIGDDGSVRSSNEYLASLFQAIGG